MNEHVSNSAGETELIAEALAKTLRPGDVVAYRGGLGAGKTAFTRGLARGLQISCDVTSPTFSLLNEYKGGGITLYHFDMYRVTDYDALCSTGFFDYLDSDGILAIEWSENIAEELPQGAITVAIIRLSDDARKIIIETGREA